MNNASVNWTSTNGWLASINTVPELNWVFMGFAISNVLLGLPANSWILWLILRGSREVLSAEILTINLAVLEVTYGLGSVLKLINLFLNQLLDGYVMFFSGLIIFGRPLLLSCICIDRYLAVVHPIFFLRSRPLRYRLACLVPIWMLTICGCVSCPLLEFYRLNFVTMAFLLPMLMLKSFLCLSVLRALRCPVPGEGPHGKAEPQLAKKRAFWIILANLMQILLSYLPVLVTIPLGSMIEEKAYFTVYTSSFFVSIFIAFLQPMHFLHRLGKLHCMIRC